MSLPLAGFLSLTKNGHSLTTNELNSPSDETPQKVHERPSSLSSEDSPNSFIIPADSQSQEDSDEEFQDALESPQLGPKADLLESISEAKTVMNLFLNNKFEMAESRMAAFAGRSMYHALGHSSTLFIKAMMTWDKQDMEKAIRAARDAGAVIDGFRAKFSLTDSFYKLSGQPRVLTDEELHAELCFAECLLLRAILTFFNDESLTSFVRGALKIRSCYQSFRECQRLLRSKIWTDRDPMIEAQFASGTHLGVGTFNLMLSTLPGRILRLLEVVGFSGDKGFGMSELYKSVSMTDTLRSTLSSLVLLSWHLFASFLVGAGTPDIDICNQLLEPLIASYPQGAIVLFFRARVSVVTGKIDNAIYFYNRSIDSQNFYQQFHHICFWELIFAHSYLRQWSRAACFAKRLADESRWSKCVYTYMVATFIYADESAPRRVETVGHLLRKVPDYRIRIAGKSLPVEKFCAMKSDRFLKTGSFLFAHYEFIYFWHGFSIMAADSNLIQPILKDIDDIWKCQNPDNVDVDDKCLYLFLRAVCLRLLQCPEKAEECLKRVLQQESQLVYHTYLPPNAAFELAQLKISAGLRDEAEQLLNKARNYKGYPLETRLHFKIHSATESMGAKTPVPT